MRHKRIIAAISLPAVLMGVSPTAGARTGQTAAKPASQSPQNTSVTRRDQAVLEALLLDLLSYDRFGTPLDKRGVQIVAAPNTNGPSQLWLDTEVEKSEKIKIAADLKADLRKRNAKPHSLKNVQFAHKNILVRDRTERPASLFVGEGTRNAFGNYKLRGYYELSLPGYSRAGGRAIVQFHETVPAGDYPTENAGVYILRKRRGRWKVVRRYFFSGE